jgi:hypothetical protein
MENARLREERDELYEALSTLVSLKNGPRDEVYQREKPLAWQRAKDVLKRINDRKDQ